MDDIVDEVDEALHNGTAYTAYAIWGDDERCTMHACTNDNLDMGYPSEDAEWTFEFLRDERGGALFHALRHTGVTRVTPGGVVSVYLNGEPVVGSHV